MRVFIKLLVQFIATFSDGFIKRTLQLERIKLAMERSIAIKIIRENSFIQKDERNYKGTFNFREGNFEKVEKEKEEND